MVGPAAQTYHEPATRFFGRDTELAKLSALVSKGSRLVTIVGAPGIGKTRLAWRLLDGLNQDGLNGVFCDLRDARSEADLQTCVRRALGIANDGPDSGSIQRVHATMTHRGPTVLVLDNFEQLLPSGSEWVSQLLHSVEATQIVVTSRHVLGIEAERRYELRPLEVPADCTENTSAIQLFMDRAEAVGTCEETGAFDRKAVWEAVCLLQGIPLALELAASQLRYRELAQVVEHLRHSMVTVSTTHCDVEDRHRSLRAAIRDSWCLLRPSDREILRTLSVFRAPFSWDDAAAVVNWKSADGAAAVLDSIHRLQDASFLHVVGSDPLTRGRRWDIYVAIREFAGATDPGPKDDYLAVRDRHATHFLQKGEALVERLGTRDEAMARAALAASVGDFERSHQWLGERERPGGEIARSALVLHATLRDAAPARVEAALTAAAQGLGREASDVAVTRGRVMLARAQTRRLRGNYDGALEDLQRASEMAPCGSLSSAEIDCELGALLHFRGDPEEARKVLARAIGAAERLGTHLLEGRARGHYACVLAEAFLDPSSLDHYEKAVESLRRVGTTTDETFFRIAWCVHRVFFGQTEVDRELRVLIETARRSGSRWLEAAALNGLGIAYQDSGRLDLAVTTYETAIGIARQSGLARAEAHGLMWLGTAFTERDEITRSSECYELALRLLESLGERRTAAMCAGFYASLLAQSGDETRSSAMLQRAEMAAKSIGNGDVSHAVRLQKARIRLYHHRRLLAKGLIVDADNCLQAATLDAAGARRSQGPHRSSFAEASAEGRAILRLLEPQIQGHDRRTPPLTVLDDGSAFRIGETPWVALPKGPAIRRILLALAELNRRDRTGACASHDMVGHGWPNEKLLPTAGAHRVREAVKRLRRLGLTTLLVHDQEGYRLDCELRITSCEAVKVDVDSR